MKKKIFIIIILIILVLVGVLFLIINHKKEYVITPKHNNITSIELSMKELYKQRVIDNSLKYLDKNGINLLNNFIIDTNSIVKSNKCTGTTQFKLGKDMYKQSVDIKCLDDSDTSSSEFSSYLFDAKKKSPIDLTDVDDGYLLISDINIITETDENGYVDTKDNDINISKYDKSFNLLWTYNYLGKEENYLDEEDLEEEDKFFATSIDYMKEYNNKFFFLINISNSSDTGSTRLLIINNDGSVYKDFRFDDYMDNIVSIDGNIVTFSYYDYIYKYNYETDELIDYTMKTSEEGEKTVLDKVDDGYLMFSTINNYTDEDEDGNNIDVEEGTNSLYLLDKELKVKKSLNLDKAIGISINNFDIDYNDIKVIDNKVYISYNTNKFYIKDGITTMEYPGILIVDMNLNVISDIKYDSKKIKYNGDKIAIESIFDFYVLNNELYLLMDFEDNDTKYDNYILIDKYDVNGKKLLNSYIRETYSTDDFEEDYFMSDQSIINYNENEIVYYIIISKDIEVGETHDNRVILKLSKVNI